MELHRPAQPVALRSRAGDQRTRARRCHRSEARIRPSRPASSCPASPGCATTARRSAATGSTADRGPKPARMMQRRGTDDPSGLGVYPNWAWSWPANRRVLYNRASCDPAGKPWDRGAQAGLVERSAAALGRHRRARFQSRLAAQGPHGPVHHESRRRGPPLRAAGRLRRRPVPGALRAVREPDRESAASEAVEQSGGQAIHVATGQARHAGRGLQHRLHHLTASPSTIITGPRTIP